MFKNYNMIRIERTDKPDLMKSFLYDNTLQVSFSSFNLALSRLRTLDSILFILELELNLAS